MFIPLFVIGMAMLRSATRAFVLAATFTGGSMIGVVLERAARQLADGSAPQESGSLLLLLTFASASAVAGGAIAV